MTMTIAMRMRAVVLVAALGGALTGALTGCAATETPQVATVGGTASTAPAGGGGGGGGGGSNGSANERENAVKFSQCMRDNGVSDFPDPNFSGGGGVSIDVPAGTDPAKVEAASAKCRQYLPNGGEPQKLDPVRLEQLRKVSQCMREHGYEDFPDPTDEGIQVDGNKANFDPADPKFQATMKECDKYGPTPPPGESPGGSLDTSR
jgi:hypothetical protein